MRRTRDTHARRRADGGARPGGRRRTDDLWLLEDEYEGIWSDGADGARRAPTQTRPPRYLEPASPRSRRAARRRRRRTIGLIRLGVAVAALVALVLGTFWLLRKVAAPSLETSGPPPDAVLGPLQLAKLTFSAEGSPADAANQRWTLDGTPVTPRAGGPDRLVYRPRRLRDGRHEFQIVASGGFLGAETTKSWSFTVDTTAPKLRLDRPAVAYAWKPVSVSGSVDEEASVRTDGRQLDLRDGRFRLRFATPPSKPVILTATDTVGNTSTWRVPITLVPRLPREPIRAVHVSADGWANSALRQGILRMIEDGRINAVELDLKDEGGVIGWPANVGLGRRYGAVQNIYDLEAAIEQLHAKGVRVIGRLVAFRDPIFAEGAWRAGRRDQVIQAPGGVPYAGYGGFSNFAHPAVAKYNIDVAVAAAKLGIDEILYDYVRRPDGPLSSMVFPGLQGTAERAIVDFLARSRKALRPYGTFTGASVFGIAATRPLEVAQDIPAMARQVDYISPMVYPSHWGPGEYEVASPEAQPYDIVRRSLEDFVRKVEGTGARIVPWLQDFSLRLTYGAAEVAAQIRATRDAGIDEFLLWDPAVSYTADGVPRGAKLPSVGTAKLQKLPASAPGLVRIAGPTLVTGFGSAVAAKVNELGVVPVLMHHRIGPDPASAFDLTPDEFRAELERLWRNGYVPVTARDYAAGRIDVPAGKKPVVMTFDDGDRSQFALTPAGEVDPETAVGIMLAFSRDHPEFPARATFYVNRDPFGAGPDAAGLLRWLVENGFEIGNHTADHESLDSLDDAGVQRQLADEARIIERAVPGYEIRTMALPFGAKPANESLAVRGSHDGYSYGPYAVMLVGAEPAPSPFASNFDSDSIPRIRTAQQPWRASEDDPAFDYWMAQLESDPSSVYVSDGDSSTVRFPESESGRLADRFQPQAKPY